MEGAEPAQAEDQRMEPVSEGLAALRANRATHIAGRLNRIMAAVMPRPLAIRLYGSMTARVLAKGGLKAGTETDRVNERYASSSSLK